MDALSKAGNVVWLNSYVSANLLLSQKKKQKKKKKKLPGNRSKWMCPHAHSTGLTHTETAEGLYDIWGKGPAL